MQAQKRDAYKLVFQNTNEIRPDADTTMPKSRSAHDQPVNIQKEGPDRRLPLYLNGFKLDLIRFVLERNEEMHQMH